MKLIPKDALVAEIERFKANALQKKEQCKRRGLEKIMYQIGAYNKVLSFLDTLEVKEVDLEEEMDKEWNKCEPIDEGMGLEIASIVNEQFDNIAKHFFELGVNASNSLTWEDIMTIYLLVQVEWNPKKSDEEIYKEVLKRFKEGKG